MTDTERAMLEALAGLGPDLARDVKELAAIPAPTFEEARRAEFVSRRLSALGLAPETDEVGNVWARIPARGRGEGGCVMVTAHMDTVFPESAHRAPVVDDDLLKGPSVRDNTAGIIAALTFAGWLGRQGGLGRDVVVAATVGEEGLGNLRGMKALCERFKDETCLAIVVDGNLGQVFHVGVGSVRLRVVAQGEGGHSWVDHGRSSAIHGLVEGLHEALRVGLPRRSKTTLNLGRIQGGLSVNAIAQEAEALVDMRSADQASLDSLSSSVTRAIRDGISRRRCDAKLETLGTRPCGSIPADHPLVRLAKDALAELDVEARCDAGSTEANVPLSLGIPSISIGAADGGGAHTPQEYLRVPSLVPGLQQIALVVARASELA